ncbi:MAG TPA: HlyD family efflux transporter periplasmic adaptor subunit [Pyrinomonadaceae bacterium]|jgi:HlyD family secretion protein|nr:HlyD family efflux transporter periplasmic adaptor subunit [Pyrinomonadaceae bacterium]
MSKAKLKKAVIALVVLSLAGGAVWYFLIRKPAGPKNLIKLSGRIEGDDATVSTKIAGRIREITVREGDHVKVGQLIAVIDDDQVNAREEQEESKVLQAEARLRSAQQQVSVLQAQLEESNIGVDQAKVDAQGRVSQAEAQVAQAEAELAKAEADYSQAHYDEERYTTLAKDGDVPERTGRQARTTAEAHAAAVRAAKRQVDVARGSLLMAKANLSNAAMRTSQATAIRQQILQAQSEISAAQAEEEHARAKLKEVQADRADLQIVAPIEGTVATRAAEPGEVVAAGTPLVTVVDLNAVYLRGFIPEGEIGRVRTGQTARVYLDSAPGKPLEAIVTRIDPEASFTPENTYFKDDRVKQVVGVKLTLKSAGGYAKPGMPADGEVVTD